MTQNTAIIDSARRTVPERRNRQGSSSERFAPDRAHRGAPNVASVANPTVWLFGAALAFWVVGWAGFLTGQLHPLVAVGANAVAGYLGFTVFHESVHRTAHRNRRVNDALGWLPAAMLSFTYSMFRTCHLKHHAHTNEPGLDPDLSVANDPGWLRPLWLLSSAVHYRRIHYRNRWGSASERRGQIIFDALIVASLPVALLTDHIEALVVLYLGPLVIDALVLYYTLDFLPHRPHTSTERYHDTRVQPGRIGNLLLLGQNYHLVHHLWVSVPWFRYKTVYEELEPQLLAQGIRVSPASCPTGRVPDPGCRGGGRTGSGSPRTSTPHPRTS